MELCSFDRRFPDQNPLLPENEKEVTPFIIARTELWRKSWIINPIAEIMRQLGLHEDIEKVDKEIRTDPRCFSNEE